MAPKFSYRSSGRLKEQVQKASERITQRMAAYIMTSARGSLRKPLKPPKKTKSGKPRKNAAKPSQPGEKPRATSAFKKNVIFQQVTSGSVFGRKTPSYVIGPRLLPGKKYKDTPEALEVGANTTREVPDGYTRGKLNIKRVRANYKARPFMVPALEKRIKEFPKLWENVIRG